MFWKRLGILSTLLFALLTHLFFGQHDTASMLVICFGEDGHVALESVHTPTAQNTSPHCEHNQDCHDVVLALEHGDTVFLPPSSQALQDLEHDQILWNAHLSFISQWLAVPAAVSSQPARSLTSPPPQLATAQRETLTHTILLI